jgi:hypothetical protein
MVHRITMSFDEFKAGQVLWRNSSPRRRAQFLILYRLLPSLGCVAVLIVLKDALMDDFRLPPWTGSTLITFAVISFFGPVYRHRRINALFKRLAHGQPFSKPIELEWNEEELIVRNPGKSEGRFRHAAILGFREDEKVAIILLGEKYFVLIPKPQLNEAEWHALRVWLEPVIRKER